jgi:hypothetical protein
MSTPEGKYEIITRRLQEVLGGDSIKAILAEGRQPKCYWGVLDELMKGKLHLAHLDSFPFRHCADRKTYALMIFIVKLF